MCPHISGTESILKGDKLLTAMMPRTSRASQLISHKGTKIIVVEHFAFIFKAHPLCCGAINFSTLEL